MIPQTEMAGFMLATMLTFAGPGKSHHSMQVVPGCGTDPQNPACELVLQCENAHDFRCKPPRWSKSRGAWVVAETRETAASRFSVAAIALDNAVNTLATCVRDGVPDEDCKPQTFIGGVRDFKHKVLTASYWESSWREDIMNGAKPSGRGAGGEACVMQVMPWLIRHNAGWLTAEQRAKLTDAELVDLVLGSDLESLQRCFEAGATLLNKAQRSAVKRCQGYRHALAMFALYGTGSKCSTTDNAHGDFAAKREAWYTRSRRRFAVGFVQPVWTSPHWKPRGKRKKLR